MKFFVRICRSPCIKRLLIFRDCGVYFKRMRAAGEFDEAKEEFEGFVTGQGLDW